MEVQDRIEMAICAIAKYVVHSRIRIFVLVEENMLELNQVIYSCFSFGMNVFVHVCICVHDGGRLILSRGEEVCN